LPYKKALIISSVAAVVLSYMLARVTSLGIWALIIAPIIVSLAYNFWKWPSYVLRLYNSSFCTFVKSGFDFSVNILNETIKKIQKQ
jgi:hypothetical protein